MTPVGAVSYPDATSWSCTATSLPAGQTTITATESDGPTASVTVTVQSGIPVRNRSGGAMTLRDRTGNTLSVKAR